MKHFRNQSFVYEFGKHVMSIRKKQGICQGMLASKSRTNLYPNKQNGKIFNKHRN